MDLNAPHRKRLIVQKEGTALFLEEGNWSVEKSRKNRAEPKTVPKRAKRGIFFLQKRGKKKIKHSFRRLCPRKRLEVRT